MILYCAFFLSLGTWIMKAFIDQLPRELEEAAAIDGAGLWQTLRLFVLPLSYAGLIAGSSSSARRCSLPLAGAAKP